VNPHFDRQKSIHGFEVRLGHRQLKASKWVETVGDHGTVRDSFEDFPVLERA
jgi:hypothetical protein